MIIRSALAALVLGLIQVASAQAQEAATVKTRLGDVRGAVQDGVAAFKGIPYAAPPVDALRWREPKPAAAWQGVRHATPTAARAFRCRGCRQRMAASPDR